MAWRLEGALPVARGRVVQTESTACARKRELDGLRSRGGLAWLKGSGNGWRGLRQVVLGLDLYWEVGFESSLMESG